MTSNVVLRDAWIPAMVEPGSVLVLPNVADAVGLDPSVCAMLTCPVCGQLAVLTETQLDGEAEVTCGAAGCTASFYVEA